jgi:nucleoside phosphorylase
MSQADSGADILLVASHAPDLAGARSWLSDKMEGTVRSLRIRAKIVGIGMPVAAASTARGILAVKPRAVLMVGTCGVYPNLADYRPHDLIIPTAAVLVSHSAQAGRAAFPEPMSTSVDCHPIISQALSRSHPRASLATVASPLCTTIDDALAASMPGATGCHAENLELFAVASACRASNVPFAAALGVSNMVGSTGRTDWTQFQRDAVTSAAAAISAWLQAGAIGLAHV